MPEQGAHTARRQPGAGEVTMAGAIKPSRGQTKGMSMRAAVESLWISACLAASTVAQLLSNHGG